MSDNENFENGIEVFYWKGQKRYKCPRKWDSGAACHYDTYDVGQLSAHMQEVHGLREQGESVRMSPIVGPQGQPVYVSEPPPDVRGAKFKKE